MLALRSLLFNIAFYANLVAWLFALVPLVLLPRRLFLAGVKAWARSSIFLMRVLAGTKLEVRGREHIPPGGLLVAAKHQSAFETFALFILLDDPAFVLKRELTFVPLFGWYLRKAGQVPVDRAGGMSALKRTGARARAETMQGRQIVIFPEGTRRPIGALPDYKPGVAHLYAALGVPCLPIALNSGLFWPRRRFIRRPGTIVIDILPPIPPGGKPREMLMQLEAVIEFATDRLVAEAGGRRPGQTNGGGSSIGAYKRR